MTQACTATELRATALCLAVNNLLWAWTPASAPEILFVGVCPIMEKAMANHSSTLAWTIPWTEEPGGLQSMASLRVGHD